MAKPATDVATSLLIHPWVLQDFYDYNSFLDSAEDVLQQAGLESQVQLANFHPAYCFAGTAPEDAENYANRSPWPMCIYCVKHKSEQPLLITRILNRFRCAIFKL